MAECIYPAQNHVRGIEKGAGVISPALDSGMYRKCECIVILSSQAVLYASHGISFPQRTANT